MEIGPVTKAEDSTNAIDISESDVKPPTQNISDRILEIRLGTAHLRRVL